METGRRGDGSRGIASPHPRTGRYANAMRVLLTNDDGIDAPGIAALEAAARLMGWDCTVVAPATEHSMCGHRITTHTPLVVRAL